MCKVWINIYFRLRNGPQVVNRFPEVCFFTEKISILIHGKFRVGRGFCYGAKLHPVNTAAQVNVGNTPPEEIASMYDLGMAEIYAALAYYYDHREEIDAIIDDNQRRADAIPADPRAAEVAARAAQREREDREKNSE